MRSRVLQCLSVAATVAALATAMATVRTQAQTPGTPTAADGKGAAALKTAWGEPDLQGIWTREFDVPLQRPPKYGNKESFTDEERSALDQQISEILGRDNAESRRERGTEKDVGGAYNAAIYTSHLRTGRRVVDRRSAGGPFTHHAGRRRDGLRNSCSRCSTDRGVQEQDARLRPGGVGRRRPNIRNIAAGGGRRNQPFQRPRGPHARRALHGQRCRTGRLPPHLRRRGQISMFDTDQGQGWRNIPMNGARTCRQIRRWWRFAWTLGQHMIVDVTNFSPKSNFQGSDGDPSRQRWTRVDADDRYAVRSGTRRSGRGRGPSSRSSAGKATS